MSTTASPVETPAPSLCERCRAVQNLELLLDDKPPGPKGYALYRPHLEIFSVDDQWPELPKLTDAAQAGCRLCQLLVQKLTTAPWRFPDLQKTPMAVKIRLRRAASVKSQRPRIIYSFDASMGSKTKLPDGTDLLVSAFFLACCTDPTLPFHRAPNRDVFSGRTVKFVKDRMEDCITSHCHSAPGSNSNFTPTRLLDLSEAATSRKVRLVLTERLRGAKYAALSYCWGDSKDAALQSKTTSANLGERMRGSDLSGLSPVAQDAVKVCLELGIQYLWIDALCILQGKDDISDWEAESVTMVDVYRNAFLTLCIAATTSCQDSFLAPRAIDPGVFIPLAGEDAPERGYEIVPFREISDRATFNGLITRSSWFERGWVWQEMNFSPRLLVFGLGMIFFECAQGRHCENGYWDHAQVLASPSRDILSDEPFQFFQKSVEVFSTKQLSFESDRLVAISGLGKEIARRTESKYVAGLWADNLFRDLLFERKARGTAPQRAEMLRVVPKGGPSWAWPAHSGGVQWPHDLWNKNSKLAPGETWRLECNDEIGFETTLAGSNIFGRVTKGVLKLRTKAISLSRLAVDRLRTYPLLKEEEKDQNALIVKMLNAYLGELTRIASFRFSWDTNNPEIGVRRPKKLQALAEDIMLVLVASAHWGRSEERDGYGLVVQRCEDRETYVRVGRFDSEAPSSRYKKGYTGGMPIIQTWDTMNIDIV